MARYDFNGDGRDDILWRNRDTKSVTDWLGTAFGGFTVNDANALTIASGSWGVAGTGDFNGDGRADILWHNSDTGAVSNWLGTTSGGFTVNDANALSAGTSERWGIVGTGDFNGDNRDDILWRNFDTGAISNWLADASGGFHNNDANAYDTLLAAWPVQGVGDFNGDGRDDIVTRHANGALNLSMGAANGALGHEDPFGQVSSDWSIAGVGDFNGDGKDDLLWRNSSTGAVSDWLYAGGLGSTTFSINDANALHQVDLAWEIAGVGDYNGDGRDDILWRDFKSGEISDWLGTTSGDFAINDAAAQIAVPSALLFQPNPSGIGLWDY